MFQVQAEVPFRQELQRELELSTQPLRLYGALVRRFQSLDPEARDAALSSPVLEDFRDWIRGTLPDLHGPFLDLQARASLLRILAETPPQEEDALYIVLLEYFVSQLEPYLQAAEQDPDQGRYLKPLCARLRLEERPGEILAAALRSARQSSRACPGPAALRKAARWQAAGRMSRPPEVTAFCGTGWRILAPCPTDSMWNDS